jgi:DnaJ-class molecular chaperone
MGMIQNKGVNVMNDDCQECGGWGLRYPKQCGSCKGSFVDDRAIKEIRDTPVEIPVEDVLV